MIRGERARQNVRLAAPGEHRALLALLVVVIVAGCAAATWWQVRRALAGNILSDVYCFAWPFYGCYVVVVWRKIRRRQPAEPSTSGELSAAADRREPQASENREENREEDAELQAYNHYLAARRDHELRRRR